MSTSTTSDVIAIEQSDLGDPWRATASVTNWTIWIAFTVELIVMLGRVTVRLDGRESSQSVAQVWKFQDGKITRFESFQTRWPRRASWAP